MREKIWFLAALVLLACAVIVVVVPACSTFKLKVENAEIETTKVQE